jgi:hypothetical protein
MGKLKKNLEIEFINDNYGFLFYALVDSNNDFIQLIQIYSRISDELVFEARIKKHKDITRLIYLMNLMSQLEKQEGTHFHNSIELLERVSLPK